MECWLYNNCNHKDCEKPFCLRKYKLDCLYRAALLPEISRQPMVLNIDAAPKNDYEAFIRLANIEQNIDIFVNESNNLFLHSSVCGNGKTSWAIRLLRAYLNKIWAQTTLDCHALFISVPKLLTEFKVDFGKNSEYINYIVDNTEKADIVVWDDIAAKIGTDYEINKLFTFIDYRVSHGKTNIYTTNLPASAISVALGERLKSRICDASVEIELVGSDKRQLQEANKKW